MAGAAENTTFKKAVRGHEVELMENYPSGFNCAICSLIINNATHGCERHVFCESCIQEYLTKSFEKECPICPGGCRKQIDPAKLSPNFTIDMMINKLKSKCSFKNCSWTGDLLDLVQDHRSQCIYATIKCSRNGCGESFLKEDKEKHDKCCVYKYLQCCYCENDVLRMNKEDHEKSCAMEKVNCIYREVGCNNVMCRRDVDKHEHDYQSLHMKLSFQNNIRNEKRLTRENINLKEKLNFEVEKSIKEVKQLKQHNYELNGKINIVVEKTTEEMNQLRKQNSELKEEVFKFNIEVSKYLKEEKRKKFLNEVAGLKANSVAWGHDPGYIEVDGIRLIIKLNKMCGVFFVAVQQVYDIVKAPNYSENHKKCFMDSTNFGNYFFEAFKIIPCHWFDFTGVIYNHIQHMITFPVKDNHIQHMITFPVKDNQIEDFCCNYTAYTVQSINNVMTVTGFPQGWIIKIAIDGEEREVEAKEEFNPFDTNKLRAAKVSGSACIIISQY